MTQANKKNEMNQEIEEIKDKIKDISFAAYEVMSYSNERREKRYIFVIVLLILLLVGTNAGWLIYESQFEVVEETTTETYTIDQNAETGNNNSVINGGEVINGEAND